jgi:hypothetical protein
MYNVFYVCSRNIGVNIKYKWNIFIPRFIRISARLCQSRISRIKGKNLKFSQILPFRRNILPFKVFTANFCIHNCKRRKTAWFCLENIKYLCKNRGAKVFVGCLGSRLVSGNCHEPEEAYGVSKRENPPA